MTVCQTAMRTKRLGVEGCLSQEDTPVEMANTSSCNNRLAKDCHEFIKVKAFMGMMLDKTKDSYRNKG